MPRKMARPDPRMPPGRVEWWQQSAPRARLALTPEKREYSRQFGVHPGNTGEGHPFNRETAFVLRLGELTIPALCVGKQPEHDKGNAILQMPGGHE